MNPEVEVLVREAVMQDASTKERMVVEFPDERLKLSNEICGFSKRPQSSHHSPQSDNGMCGYTNDTSP
jgi:hypothetical protein